MDVCGANKVDEEQKVCYVRLELSRVVKRWAINFKKVSEGTNENEDDEDEDESGEEEVGINEIGKLTVGVRNEK